jgi:predicted double-glycine peptidase
VATRFWTIPRGAIRIPIPDTRQDRDFSCGASSLLSVCLYYGVGPVEESAIVRDSGMSERGANPEHLVRVAAKYGLKTKETQPMSLDQLQETVARGRPVLCMLQAWGDRKSYRTEWGNGHWVVAIGFDNKGIYFEDPWILDARGFLTFAELDDRWHDVGRYNKHVPQYGLTVWRTLGVTRVFHVLKARRIP